MIETRHLKHSPRQQLVLDILHSYYPDIYRKELLRHVIMLATQKEPLYVRVGRAHLLVNAEKKIVVSSHFSSIFDYCSALNDKSLQIRSDILEAYDYQLNLQNMRRMGASEYPINPLFWQIFSRLLPEKILFNSHHLDIKVKFSPNFDVIGQVPECYSQIAKDCEQEIKTIAQLQSMYPDIDPMELHRLFLLYLLTDVVDEDVLSYSFAEGAGDNKNANINTDLVGHTEINPAGNNSKPSSFSTSFLSRLFKKS